MPNGVLRVGDIEDFHWKLSEADGSVSLSSDGAGFSLTAAVELAMIHVHRRRASDGPMPFIRTQKSPICSMLVASRWPECRNRVKLRDSGITLVALPRDANDSWWTGCLRDLLAELGAHGFPKNMARGLTGAVAEMADNVWQHSKSAEPGLFVYAIRKRKFAFSIADTGIGVLASLRENRRYRWLTSSMDAIQLAIRPGISSKDDSGGMGFSSLLHSLADLWGNARVRSGQSRVLIDRTQHTRKVDYMYLPDLPGLHVSVRCSVDPPGQLQADA